MSHTSSGPMIVRQFIHPLHRIQVIFIATKNEISITPNLVTIICTINMLSQNIYVTGPHSDFHPVTCVEYKHIIQLHMKEHYCGVISKVI